MKPLFGASEVRLPSVNAVLASIGVLLLRGKDSTVGLLGEPWPALRGCALRRGASVSMPRPNATRARVSSRLNACRCCFADREAMPASFEIQRRSFRAHCIVTPALVTGDNR